MSRTQQHPQHLGRSVAAIAVSIVVGPGMIWAGLICVVTIIQQVLSGFFDFSQASWTQAFNPAVWLGLESIGGTGGILDALIGGPGAPGGTVSRYFTFMLFGLLTAASYAAITMMWNWARPRPHTTSQTTPTQ
jgi:hypothetical protein